MNEWLVSTRGFTTVNVKKVSVTRQLTFVVSTLLHSNAMTIMHGVLR
jgi:hypothetical protein